MTDLKASSEFQTYPNDPDLWLVLSDFLLDQGDDSGAELARLKAEFWQFVRETGLLPFRRKRSKLWGDYVSNFMAGWAWANCRHKGVGAIIDPTEPDMLPPPDHPCDIDDDSLFQCLPDGDYTDNARAFWILTWKTEERAWDALWVAWQKWRGGGNDAP